MDYLIALEGERKQQFFGKVENVQWLLKQIRLRLGFLRHFAWFKRLDLKRDVVGTELGG